MGILFKSVSATFSVAIRTLIMELEYSVFSIQFVWSPSHVEIEENKRADLLAKLTLNIHS